MKEYLLKMKTYSDVLASAGCKVSKEGQILYVLARLGVEYDSVVVSVTSRVEPCMLADVNALLLAYESRFEHYTVNTDVTQPSANMIYKNHQRKFSGHQKGNQQFSNNQQFNGNRGRVVVAEEMVDEHGMEVQGLGVSFAAVLVILSKSATTDSILISFPTTTTRPIQLTIKVVDIRTT